MNKAEYFRTASLKSIRRVSGLPVFVSMKIVGDVYFV